MALDKKVDTIIGKINRINGNNKDIVVRKYKIRHKNIICTYLESVASDDKITEMILKSLSFDIKKPFVNIFDNIYNKINNTLPSGKLTVFDNISDMFFYMASGFACIIVDDACKGMAIEAKANLNRSISEPTTEKIIRGPKDSFTENYSTNVGLIRKRIKDTNLWFKQFFIGKRTKTKVSVAYINDIVRNDILDNVLEKLNDIEIDGILDSGYIRDFLTEKHSAIFPTVISTERPDLVSESLLDGKIAIIVENSPFVLIVPGLLVDFFHTAEDKYQKAANVSFSRILRIFSFVITITIPGLYIAVTTFNHEVLPSDLLVSIAIQKNGVPFPTIVELLILTIFFELLRESDIRTPDVMGNSISIVGALILGDAAVAAGIVSPIVVMVVATSSVSSMLFSDIDIINACRWWRFFFLFGAATLGLIGLLIVGIMLIIKLVSINSFGISYLTPVSPFYGADIKNSLISVPRYKEVNRPKFLSFKNIKRLGGNNEN